MESRPRHRLARAVALAAMMLLAGELAAGCPKTVLATDGSTSSSARAPIPVFRFERAVYLITAAELAASGMTSGAAITGIGWRYATAPIFGGSGPLKVYLENTADTTNSKSTTWSNAIVGMTKVHSRMTYLPEVTGSFDIAFSGGSAFTYDGGGLYVAFDWGDYYFGPATGVTVACNQALPNGLMGAHSDTEAPVTLEYSSYRPETRLDFPGSWYDASVDMLYSVGSLPLGLVSGEVFKAIVSNTGCDTLTDLPITLSVSGADTFTDTTILTLAPGSSATVSFAGYTPAALGSCTVTATVPDDAYDMNNSKSHPLDVTANVTSYKYPGTTPTGGLGTGGHTIEMLARFRADAATQLDSVILELPSLSTATYRVSIRGDDGHDFPGGQLYLDPADRSVASTGSVTIALPSPVAVGPGAFFVGIQQTNTSDLRFSFDAEDPIRTGAFFLAMPIGGTWYDFSPLNNFKLNIGAILGACLVPLGVDVTADGSSTACPGNGITFTATPTGGTGPFTYQWTGDGVDIPGAQGPSYTATQTSAGTHTYNCKVSDAGACLAVEDPTPATGTWGPITVVNPANATGGLGAPFGEVFTASGGKAPYDFSTISTLPAGLNLAPDGTLGGTPTESGSFPISVTATDADGCTGTGTEYPLVVLPPASFTSATGATFKVLMPGTFTVTAAGLLPMTISRTGALPRGVTFVDHGNGTATLAGTPAAGTGKSYPFTLTAHNAGAPDATQGFTLTVVPTARTTTNVASSRNPAPPGTAVRFTARVSFYTRALGTPTGTIQFFVDGDLLGSPVRMVSAQASSVWVTLPSGTHAVTARYSGDGSFLPSKGTLAGGQQVP